MTARRLQLGEVSVDVIFKDIKNVHLSVHPPTGRVRISAPVRMKLDTVRAFAVSRIKWIKNQQRKFAAQRREAPRGMLERESHYLWGVRHLLEIKEKPGRAEVETRHKKLRLYAPPGAAAEKRRAVLDDFYRAALRKRAADSTARWEKRLGVSVNRIFIQRMKTKWGSSNPAARNVRLNLELAKKPPECLDYILLHEMLHFFTPNHGEKFTAMLDQHMPHWRIIRRTLNDAPLGSAPPDRPRATAAGGRVKA